METRIAPKFVFDIYASIFGYKAIPFPAAVLNKVGNQADNSYKADGFYVESSSTSKDTERLSAQGAVLYKKEANGTEAFCPVDIYHPGTKKNYSLPYSTVSVTRSKNIVETALPGRKGTVKELIQIEDTQLQIQGVILGDDLPETEISELNELFEINEAVQFKNAFAEIFMKADNNVIIKDLQCPDMKGITGAQAYSFVAITDSVLELEEV
jgi:hypothetical protein